MATIKCKACGTRTMGSTGYCQSCKSMRHHGYKRLKAENLLLDEAGGAWWIWDPRGDVVVSGKPTRAEAVIALGRGEDDVEDDVPASSEHHATKKTAAQLDAEIATVLAKYAAPDDDEGTFYLTENSPTSPILSGPEFRSRLTAKRAAMKLVRTGKQRSVEVWHRWRGDRYMQGLASKEGWSDV